MIEVEIPKQVRVAGFDYQVVIGGTADEDLRASNWIGSHSNRKQLIQIASGITAQQTSNTFIHEIVHAVSLLYVNDTLDEHAVNALANGLHQVFEDMSVRFVKE